MSNSNLSDEQVAELQKPLDPARVKHRQGGGGMQLAYLRGLDVIDRANEIFSFGGWGYDVISNEFYPVLGESGEILGGYYAARIKLSVYGCMPITEEGVCPVQEGRNPRARIDAHDMARKGAITDAMKRAFRCFGDQFGNSLYDTDLVDGQPGTEKVPANASSSNSQPQPQRQQPAPQAPRTVTPPSNYSKPIQAPIAAPLPPKVSSGVVVLGEANKDCPKCAGPLDLLEVFEENGHTYRGIRCAAKGCGYKRKLEADEKIAVRV